jgi:hypothetical protein
MPTAVAADDVTVYPTEDSWMDEGHPEENYGSSGTMVLCNDADDRGRALIRIDDQSGGGNVTEVLLKLYYAGCWGVEPGPGYRPTRAYRVTRDFVEDEVDWEDWKNGSSWTSEGGDYTSLNYVESYFPSSYGWMTWNITDMALDAWGDSDDLYVLIKFVSETKGDSPESFSFVQFYASERVGTNYDPRVVVTYDEDVQTPEVDSDIDEYGSTYVDLNIYPTLYDWPSANVTAQVAKHGSGTWNYTSAVLEIDDNEAVLRTVTGLSKSTQYDARAKLVYASGTVYSANSTFTTPAYTMPTWDIDADTITVDNATVYAGWTGNTDGKTIYAKVAYKRYDYGSWEYTSGDSSSDASDEFSWVVDGLRHDWTYDYKGVYTIDGYIYETDVEQFETADYAGLNVTVSDVTSVSVQLKADYVCGDISEIDLWSRIRYVTSSKWTNSDTRESLTGNGTEYFVFDNLLPAHEYVWEVRADFDGGTSVETDSVWSIAIEDYPEVSNLDASFVEPNIMRVSCDVVLNDALTLEPQLYCRYKLLTDSTYGTSHDIVDVTSDGNWYVDLVCGDELDWDSGYDFYLSLNYYAGTEDTDAEVFYTPDEGMAVVTVGVTGISGTSATFRGYGQMGEFDLLYTAFEYWVKGSLEDTYTRTEYAQLTDSGSFSQRVDDLVYGETYVYQALISDTAGTGEPLDYGGQLEFVAGYWDGDEPPEDEGTYTIFGDLWNWLRNSTAGHWTILLCGMGVLALIFHKRKEIAIVLCLMVLGIGIVIGWVDTWIIVLLGIGVGLWVWRLVRGQRQGGAV